jgi:hypothetical protein
MCVPGRLCCWKLRLTGPCPLDFSSTNVAPVAPEYHGATGRLGRGDKRICACVKQVCARVNFLLSPGLARVMLILLTGNLAPLHLRCSKMVDRIGKN